MTCEQQKAQAAVLVGRLLNILRDASRISAAAITGKERIGLEPLTQLSLAAALAEQVSATALAGLAAVGLSPGTPSGLSSDEVGEALFQTARCQAKRLPPADPQSAELFDRREEIAAEMLLSLAGELLGLSVQALARAQFFLKRAEVMAEAMLKTGSNPEKERLMKQTPEIDDVFKGDDSFVHGFKFPSGYQHEPVQVGVTKHSDNACDESRKDAKFRVLRVDPYGGAETAHGSFGYRIFAIRLNDDCSHNPAGEHIVLLVGRLRPLAIIGKMKLVFEPLSDWPEPAPKSPPVLLHRCC
jgi:hypothetical protein